MATLGCAPVGTLSMVRIMAKKKASSPYAKYGKRPVAYSAHLRSWESAIRAGNKEAAEEAALAHERQFGYRRKRET